MRKNPCEANDFNAEEIELVGDLVTELATVIETEELDHIDFVNAELDGFLNLFRVTDESLKAAVLADPIIVALTKNWTK